MPRSKPFTSALPRRALLLIMLFGLAAPRACLAASPHAHVGHAPGDPWEGANRNIYAFNQVLDRILVRPLSRLTNGLTPGPVGKAIKNFLVNLNEPVIIVNDLLQAKPGRAVQSAFRLVVNTTAGGLGAIDVATALHVPVQHNGFGDTLGRWGVKPGPYIVIPVFGPSSVRDLLGMLVDDATLPLQSVNYPYRTEVDITVNLVGGLNEREDVAKDLDTLLDGAADPYATLRSSYLQAREAQVRGGTAIPALPDFDDTPPPSPPPDPPKADSAPPAAPTSEEDVAPRISDELGDF